jgi:hypothetical protein
MTVGAAITVERAMIALARPTLRPSSTRELGNHNITPKLTSPTRARPASAQSSCRAIRGSSRVRDVPLTGAGAAGPGPFRLIAAPKRAKCRARFVEPAHVLQETRRFGNQRTQRDQQQPVGRLRNHMMRQPKNGCSSADNSLAAKYPPIVPMPPTSTRLQPRLLVGIISASSA